LALPKLTGKGVAPVCHQQRVLLSRGETRAAEPKQNEVPGVEIVVPSDLIGGRVKRSTSRGVGSAKTGNREGKGEELPGSRLLPGSGGTKGPWGLCGAAKVRGRRDV
jgi:hypothetical protein